MLEVLLVDVGGVLVVVVLVDVLVVVVVCGGPVDTTMFTFDPGGSGVPGLGSWDTTMPAGCCDATWPMLPRLSPFCPTSAPAAPSLRPTREGAGTLAGPDETVSVTVLP